MRIVVGSWRCTIVVVAVFVFVFVFVVVVVVVVGIVVMVIFRENGSIMGVVLDGCRCYSLVVSRGWSLYDGNRSG